ARMRRARRGACATPCAGGVFRRRPATARARFASVPPVARLLQSRDHRGTFGHRTFQGETSSMALKNFFFTSESVSEGHPDKMCDLISDAVVDEILRQDPKARIACETLCKTGMVVIAGEITTNAKIAYNEIARETIKDIGYTSSDMGFDYDTCAVLT